MGFIQELLSNEVIMLYFSIISLLVSFISLLFSVFKYKRISLRENINDIVSKTKTKTKINKEKTIAMVYFSYMKVKFYKIRILLASVFTIIFPYSIYAQKSDIFISSVVILFIYFLINMHNNFIKYRIINGYFGNNYSEARALISFMVEYSDDIDFDDSDGLSRKKLFFPERKPNSLIPNILGEKA